MVGPYPFYSVSTLIDRVLNLLFPVDCVLCGKSAKEWEFGVLCRTCATGFKPVEGRMCPRCGYQAPAIDGLCGRCRTGDTRYDFGRAALVFDESLRLAIHHFKYNDRVSLVRPFGAALRACLECQDFVAELIVPVPLHRSRERERGYKQAELLAATLGRPVDRKLLRRRRPTATQTGLTQTQRAVNVRGAFEIRRKVSGSVLIVDDVETTGSTINEVAKVLRRGGASRVEVLTLARVAEATSLGPEPSELLESR